jgi:predicted phosphate transport protein (TIGR00153 family)
MGLKEWIIPQDRIFFDLLERESDNVLQGAAKLEEAILGFDQLAERRKEMKDIEHDGDEIVHQIYEKVNKSFITPIDQGDLTRLASLYDDVLDYCYAVINRLVLYQVKAPTDIMRSFARQVKQSVDHINSAFQSMRKLDKKEIDQRCIEVDRLENEADELLNDAVADLFSDKDVIEIIKLKEIYENFETITDKCEDVTQVLRDVLIKQT